MSVFVNGRFLGQPVSGVQRYARELMGALDRLLEQDRHLHRRLGPVTVLCPPMTDKPPRWSRIACASVGRGGSHYWEQRHLGPAARAGTLLSLGSSGPILHRRQVIAFHDANVWHVPQAYSAGYRFLHRRLRPVLARRAARLITVSRFSAGELAAVLGVPESGFDIIGNSAAHVLGTSPEPGMLARHGLRPGGYLLAVGNQTANKNIARLIAAHDLAGPDIAPLVIAGGFAPGMVRNRPGGSARVTFTGRVSDGGLRALYDGALALVFASLREGFGIPPLEAMQLGVPVIASRATALPEVLGDAPMWFDPCSTRSIAAALRSFQIAGPDLRERMIAAGLARAARFDWDRGAERLAAVLIRAGQEPDRLNRQKLVRQISVKSVPSPISRP